MNSLRELIEDSAIKDSEISTVFALIDKIESIATEAKETIDNLNKSDYIELNHLQERLEELTTILY